MPDFTTERLPVVPGGSMPPELFDSPLGELATEYVRLRDEFNAAVAELRALQGRAPAAKEADGAMLAAAMAAGKRDPGDANLRKLEGEFAAQRRRVDGLGDAARDAFLRLRTALAESGDEWAAELRSDADAARAAMDAAMDDLETACRKVDKLNTARRWLTKVADRRDRHDRDFPSLTSNVVRANLGTQHWDRASVYAVLRESAEGRN